MAPLVALAAFFVGADLESLLAKAATYHHGASREALVGVTQMVTDALAAPAQRKQVESRLLRFIESNATTSAKEFALRELSRVGSEASIPRLKALLKQPDLAEMAAYAIARISGPAPPRSRNLARAPDPPRPTGALIERFPKLHPKEQIVTLAELADRGDRAALPLLTTISRSGEGEVRITALAGLGRLGDASSVTVLAGTAANSDGAAQAAAREALYGLRAAGVDEAIVAAMRSAAGRLKVELIVAAGERGIAAASPLLIAAVQEKDTDVHREALRALRNVAGAADVPALLGLLLQAATAADRRESAQTLASVLKRTDPARVSEVVAAYEKSPPSETRLAFIDVMGQSSSEAALPLLRRLLTSPDAPVARATILALTEWATVAPMPDLLALARAQQNPALQVLALRGYLRLLALPSERSPAATATLLGEAMTLARQPAEKRTILSMLANFACKEALAVAEAATKDRDVAREAAAAVDRLNGLLRFL